jgi:hypothetical protein
MVEPENLILTMLRRLDEKCDRVIDDVRDLKARVTALDEGQAALQHGMASITERAWPVFIDGSIGWIRGLNESSAGLISST